MLYTIGIFYQNPDLDPVAELMANRGLPGSFPVDYSRVENCEPAAPYFWNGKLVLKPGRKTPEGLYPGAARVEDVDFEKMERDRAAELPEYIMARFQTTVSAQVFTAIYPDEETYRQVNSRFITFGVYCADTGWSFGDYQQYDIKSLEYAKALFDWKLAYADRFIKPAVEAGSYLLVTQCRQEENRDG